MDSIPVSGRSPEGGHGNRFQYSCLENLMDRGAWRAGYSPKGCKESDVTEAARHAHTYGNRMLTSESLNLVILLMLKTWIISSARYSLVKKIPWT